MSRRICTMAAAAFCPALLAAPPPGSAVRVLSPTFFPGWQMYNVCYPFVVQEGGTYRMHYSGSGTEQVNDSVWDQWMTGSVTSADTLSWRRPDDYEQTLFARKCYVGDVLNPDELAASFDSVFAIGLCVLKEDSTYKGWYTGWNGEFEHTGGGICKKINFRVGHATSPDGIRWSKKAGDAGAGAVLGLGAAGQQDARGVAHPHVLKMGGEYRMWYEGYDGTTWRLFWATSSDGINWTRQGLALGPGGATSRDHRGLRNPLVFSRKGKYELWYQGQSTAAPNFHILRATSEDARTWTKLPGEVTLHPESPPTGSESILVDSALVLPDGAVQVFFAKQVSTSRSVDFGTATIQSYHIYTEVVNP